MTYGGKADVPNRSGFSVSVIVNPCIALITARLDLLHNAHLSVSLPVWIPNDSVPDSSLSLFAIDSD